MVVVASGTLPAVDAGAAYQPAVRALKACSLPDTSTTPPYDAPAAALATATASGWTCWRSALYPRALLLPASVSTAVASPTSIAAPFAPSAMRSPVTAE